MPGPGQYQIETSVLHTKAAEYSIGRAKRPDIVRNNYPGPGKYQVATRLNAHAYKFSRSERLKKANTQSPGPSYNPVSTLSKIGGVISQRLVNGKN